MLVVDRDKVLGVSEPRRGTPYAIHAHALHARGHLILEELFPGLTEGLSAAGIPTCDLGEMHWYLNARRIRPARTGLISVMAPRPTIVKICGWEPHRPSGDRRPGRRCCRTRW